MANSKSTKKFQKKHLKKVIEQRKDIKLKKRKYSTDKKKIRKSRDAEFFKGPTPANDTSSAGNHHKTTITDMSVDEFFEGGFDNILSAPKENAKKLGKRKRDQTEDDERKRQAPSSKNRKQRHTHDETGAEDQNEDGDNSDEDSMDEDALSGSGSDVDDEDADFGVGMSKEAMDDLAKDDPEFYNYLKENDPEALNFDESLGDMADLLEDDSGTKGQDSKKKKDDDAGGVGPSELTVETVARWQKLLDEQKSLRAAKEVVLAFRSAALLNEAEDDKTGLKYIINDSQAYNDVLVLALKQIPLILQHHVPTQTNHSGKIYFSTQGKKYKNLSSLIRSFAASALHLLETLADDNTVKLTISSLNIVLPYLLPLRKLVKAIIKTMAEIWARPMSSDTVRLTAFLVIRKLVVISDRSVREAMLKAVYQSLLQGCRLTNVKTIKGINMMKSSAAALWGIDQQIGYTTAFILIRQLAIHLRNSIIKNQGDSYKQVYNWQYVHALDFWSIVLAEHCRPLKEAETGKESLLRPLIYPCVQVTIGAMRLIPSSQYYPLRFHLIRALLRISHATNTYIPLAPFLMEVLESVEMKKPAKPTTKVIPLDFALNYRAAKAYLRTRVYQQGVGQQVVELFSEYFYLHCTSIAFPELALPVVIMIKRWLKQTRRRDTGNKNNKVASDLAILVQKIEANAKFIEEKRSKIDFAPKDRVQVKSFLRDLDLGQTPLGAFTEAQRTLKAQRVKEEEEARAEEKKRQQQMNKSDAKYESSDDEDEVEGGNAEAELEMEGDYEEIDSDEDDDVNGVADDSDEPDS